MKLHLRLFLLIAIILSALVPKTGLAQHGVPVQYNIGIAEGLPSMWVNDIAKDGQGRMWFATKLGLSIYDGERLVTIDGTEDRENQFQGSNVTQLFPLADTAMLVVTDISVSYSNLRSERFTTIYQARESNCYGRPINVATGPSGAVWITHCDTLLNYKYVTALPDTIPLPEQYYYSENWPMEIRHILPKKQDQLWLLVRDKLLHFDLQSKVFTEHFDYEPYSTNVSDGIYRMCYDDGKMWLGTNAGQVVRYDFQSKQHKRYHIGSLAQQGLANIHQIKPFNGSVYFVVNNIGLGKYDAELDSIQLVNHPLFELPANRKIVSIHMDHQQAIWVGQERTGVNYIRMDGGVQHISTASGHGLRIDFISSILRDHSGRLWIGTDGDGLYTQDSFSSGMLHRVSGIRSNTILSLFEDDQGKIWVGTYRQGIQVIDPVSFLDQTPRLAPANRQLFELGDIRAIRQDHNGHMWFAVHAQGVVEFDQQTQSVRFFNTKSRSPLAGDWTFDLDIDRLGHVWVASNSGVSMIDLQADTIYNYYSDTRDDQALEGHVYSINAQTDRILAGGVAGLYQYDSPNDGFVNVPGLSRIGVHAIVNWGNRFAVGMAAGLNLITPHPSGDWTVSSFTGIPSQQYANNAAFVDVNGQLLLGGDKGLTLISADVHDSEVAFAPKLTDLLVNDEQLKAGLMQGGTFNRWNDKTVRLKFDQNNLHLFFSTLDYRSKDAVDYRYRLKNYSKTWKICNDGQLLFSNLPTGNYELVVISVKNGVESESQAVMWIQIGSPPWSSVWAISLYLIVGFTLLFLSIRYARNQYYLRLQQARFDEQSKLNDWKFEFFSRISHDIRTPVTMINAPLEELYTMEQAPGRRKDLLAIMRRNTGYLIELVSELLDYQKMTAAQYEFKLRTIEVAELVGEITTDFEEVFAQQNITLSTNLETCYLVADSTYLKKCVFNLLGNCLKYLPADSRVEVVVEVLDGEIIIRIADNGDGFNSAVFDHFEKAKTTTYKGSLKGYGIGLGFVQSIVQQLGGNLTLHNDNGAIVEMRFKAFPVPDETVEQAVMEGTIDQESVFSDKKLVLIVEDNFDIRTYLAGLLEPDYTVVQAQNGSQAIAKLEHLVPDLIVSDIMMPEVDGLALCRWVKANRSVSHVPFLFLSAKTEEVDQLAGLQLGALDYLTKPFNPHILQAKVQSIMSYAMAFDVHFEDEGVIIASEVENPYERQFMDQLVLLINERYEDAQLSVEDLASSMAMTRGTLYKKCMALCAKSPIDLIQEKRITMAGTLLRESSMSITDIAYQVGYSSPRYFSKRFKKVMGVKPSEYR